jgi:hypothetical protein
MIKSKRKIAIKSRGSSPVDETEIVDRRSRRRRNVAVCGIGQFQFDAM